MAVTVGADGLLWVLDDTDPDYGNDAIVGISTTGKREHVYYAAYPFYAYGDLATGSDGALWLTDGYRLQITRMTTGGQFSDYQLQNGISPMYITNGPDKALWFTASSSSRGAIGRITTKGKVTEYPLTPEPWDIATGPDGALWFTEPFANAIGRMTTAGKLSQFTAGITAQPFYLASGPDGAMWFTETSSSGGKIGRITTSGKVTEYSAGLTATNRLMDIASGPDEAMWFTESGYDYVTPEIGRISMRGRIDQYSNHLATHAAPDGIVAGPDGNMWFVDSNLNKTGRVRI